MEIKINFICNIRDIFDDYIKYIKEEHKSIYFGNKYNEIEDNVYCLLDSDIINKIVECIRYTDYCIKKNDNNLIIQNLPWNICITKKNFMFDFPYTLKDTIFFPMEYINRSTNKELIKTLFHEYIHICQRINPSEWNKYINKYSKTKYSCEWIKIKDIKNIPLLNEIIILNPDTYYEDDYLLKKNNKYYKGNLVYQQDGRFKTEWFLYENGNLNKINDKLCQYEHPFEMLAYEISNCVDYYLINHI